MKIEKIVHNSKEYDGDYNSDPRRVQLIITPESMKYNITEKNGEKNNKTKKTPEKGFEELVKVIERSKFFSWKVKDEFDCDRPQDEETLYILTDSKKKSISLSVSVISDAIGKIVKKMYGVWRNTIK
ncbi:MAG: hypothetical protein ABII22_06220 [Candidatus Micrarchaeota archaeon]